MTNLNAAATSGELLEGKHSLTPEIIDKFQMLSNP